MNDYRKLSAIEIIVLLICGVMLAALVAWLTSCSSLPRCPDDCKCNAKGEIEWCPYMKDLIDDRKVKWQ